MLKGMILTPPVIGRISIGKLVEKNGKRLPEKDDQFTLTTQVQGKEGWVRHPLDESLREGGTGKLRAIPIRFIFNSPALNFRAQYCYFDRTKGRPMCVGDGETCRRHSEEGVKALPCPAPEGCPLATGGACKPFGRLNVLIGEDDPFGSFIFRTSGFNSIRTLATRLEYFKAISGDQLSALPLELRLRGKSTRQSLGTPIYFVDLTLRSGMTIAETLQSAQDYQQAREEAGYQQSALETAAARCFGNGAFEDGDEEGAQEMAEFFVGDAAANSEEVGSSRPDLLGKLERKTAAVLS